MQIYLFLIAFLLITAFICKSLISDNEKAEKTILKIVILAVFLILSLKKETVGIDIIGYKEQYLISQFKSWENVDYVYFETGYIQLMKLFSKAGISFQWFTVFIYALLCTALYFFIKTVSENVTMSLLIFICFQFFVFSASALRQTIAMSLCMLAYLALKRSDKIINLFIAIGIVLIAFSSHRSAIVFLPVLGLACSKKTKINIVPYIVGMIISFFARGRILQYISDIFDTDKTNTQIELGGAFIFTVLTVLFSYFLVTANYNVKNDIANKNVHMITGIKVLMFSIACSVLFSGSTLLRATMYPNLFIMACIPNAPGFLSNKGERNVVNFVFGVFFIVLFVLEALIPNQLEICPYKFFWQ